MFRKLHTACPYTNIMANPFYILGENIISPGLMPCMVNGIMGIKEN